MSSKKGVPSGKSGRSSPKAALLRELDAITEALGAAVETGAGLPELARVASRALDASVAILDASGSILAVAGASRADEKELKGSASVPSVELRTARKKVGQLRFRTRKGKPDEYLIRLLATVIALEVERLQAPGREREDAVSSYLKQVVEGEISSRKDLAKRADEISIDIGGGALVVAVNFHTHNPRQRDWRAELLPLVVRSARGSEPNCHGAVHGEEAFVFVPGRDAETGRQVADRIVAGVESDSKGVSAVTGISQVFDSAEGFPKAVNEARLAANVASSSGKSDLSFSDAGAYRLLLPVMSEEPDELNRFYSETVQPLLEYDRQYRTELLTTLETYLRLDAKIEATAKELYAHRHTIRYRLERIKELTGLDVSSSEGREKLSLGLKAMRVLGVPPPRLTEAGGGSC